MADKKPDRLTVFNRLFKFLRLGLDKSQNQIRPTERSIGSDGRSHWAFMDMPLPVQKFWDYWMTQCHDDATSFENRELLYNDLDMILLNCLGASEKIVTKEYGLRPISELVGEEVTLLTSKGWHKGKIGHFGKGILYDVHFTRRGLRKSRVVRATLNHRWRLDDGSFVETKDLQTQTYPSKERGGYKPASTIPYTSADRPIIDETSLDYIYGIRHGLIYGDGSTFWSCERSIGYNIRICTDSEDLLPYFKGYTVNYPPSFNGEPLVTMFDSFAKTTPLKELPYGPESESDEYLTGFFRGWLAADGYISKENQVSLCCGPDEEAWLRRVMPKIGIHFNGSVTRALPGDSHYIRNRISYHRKHLVELKVNRLTLKNEDFIIQRKRDRYSECPPSDWHFNHIDYESGKEEDIFCAVVPETQDFTLEDGLLTGNSPLLARGKDLTRDEVYQADANFKTIGIDASPRVRDYLMEFHDKIVADKFHALRLLNPALMKLRKQINGNRLELKQRRLLLRNREDLKYFDKRELDCFLEKHPDLEELYFYKERLRVFYQSRNTRQAISYINLFIGDLENSAIEAAQVLGRTLKRWQAPLVEYFRNRWTNGFTEATNGNAKALQKRARGFKNFVNYRAKTLNACFY
jgi:hypothetical protein